MTSLPEPHEEELIHVSAWAPATATREDVLALLRRRSRERRSKGPSVHQVHP